MAKQREGKTEKVMQAAAAGRLHDAYDTLTGEGASHDYNPTATKLRKILKEMVDTIMDDWNRVCPICFTWTHTEDCEVGQELKILGD
jgi:hypothetical protein